MKVQHLALGIFTFSLVLTMVNGLGIFTLSMPESNLDPSQAEVIITEYRDDLGNTVDTGWLESTVFGAKMVLYSLEFIFGALLTAIYITPLLQSYSIDLRIIVPFQSIIWFIYGWAIIQWITGRSTKGMD